MCSTSKRRCLAWGEDKLAPVYAAPGINAYRAANGRAAVSLRGDVTVIGASGGWVLVSYQISNRTARFGYVPAAAGAFDAPELRFSAASARLAEKSYWTDDPDVSQFVQGTLSAGRRVQALAAYNAFYAYVETKANGKAARAFVPLAALIVEPVAP